MNHVASLLITESDVHAYEEEEKKHAKENEEKQSTTIKTIESTLDNAGDEADSNIMDELDTLE